MNLEKGINMIRPYKKQQLYWLWLSASSILLDQFSKYFATIQLNYYEPIEILPMLNLALTSNRGSAWGFLNSASGWQIGMFAAISAIASVLLLRFIYRLPPTNHWSACAFSLILGGAIGNLIDRFTHGYVVDFIQVHYQHWYFPVFNVADSAITIGAIMLIISFLKKNRSNSNSENPDEISFSN